MAGKSCSPGHAQVGAKMGRYIVRRFLQAIPQLFIISIIVFALLYTTVDPIAAMTGDRGKPRPETRKRLERKYGLDQPWPVQYLYWLIGNDWLMLDLDFDGVPETPGSRKGILRGDFGYSFRSRSPVSDLMLQRLPTTLYVIGSAYLISVLLAIPIGVISAIRQYSIFDNIATTLAFIGFSLPTFFTGLLFILIFSVKLGWFPMIYRATIDEPGLRGLWMKIEQAIMPITVLALFQTAALTRYTRASMLETIHQDYVRTARAKGLSELTVISRHALRNALIPVITTLGPAVAGLLTGSIVIENIFGVPGVGRDFIQSIGNRDYSMIMGTTLFYVVLILLGNLSVDILYGVVDPRIRVE